MASHNHGTMSSFFEDEGPSYYDTPGFLAYVELVEQTIFAGPGRRGMNTRAIHDKLGSKARREWTQDALDKLKTIEPIGLLPTRWRPKHRTLNIEL